MNINATLIGQSFAFAFFVWFCMRYVWPPLMKILEDRRRDIATGLAAAEEGVQKLKMANKEGAEVLREAQSKAQILIDKANKQAVLILEEAKEKATEETFRLKEVFKVELDQEVKQARDVLRNQVADLVIFGAEKILGKAVDKAANKKLVDDLAAKL